LKFRHHRRWLRQPPTIAIGHTEQPSIRDLELSGQSDDGLRALDELMPAGAAADERYAPDMMRLLNG